MTDASCDVCIDYVCLNEAYFGIDCATDLWTLKFDYHSYINIEK